MTVPASSFGHDTQKLGVDVGGIMAPVRAPLVDIEGLADWLGTSVRHVRRLVAEKRLPYLKVGHLVRFDPEDIACWIKEKKVGAVDNAGQSQPG